MTINPQRLLLILAVSPFLLGVKPKKVQESILDKLERRLLEKERGALSFGEAPSKIDSKKPVTKYKYKNFYINERLPKTADFLKIEKAITELESQTEYLASQVQAIKQKILQDASINNQIAIHTIIDDKNEVAFKNLTVSIDGHPIYQQNAALGLWTPTRKIPLFRGPIQPGEHRLDFQARLIQKNHSNLPLHKDSYHMVNESFNFRVPGGQFTKTWEIRLHTPGRNEYKAKAIFKAVE